MHPSLRTSWTIIIYCCAEFTQFDKFFTLSYILNAQRSFSSGDPEAVMSVASMNSLEKVSFLSFDRQVLMLYDKWELFQDHCRKEHLEVDASIPVLVKYSENLIDKNLLQRDLTWEKIHCKKAKTALTSQYGNILFFFFLFFLSWHHSDQMSQGSQKSKVCVQILK